MAIINRDGDNSEKKEWCTWVGSNGVTGIPTGASIFLCGPIPYPYQFQTIQAYAVGMSGAPQLAFYIFRPLVAGPGASFPGCTYISIGNSNMVLTNGLTAMPLGYSGLVTQGSTLLIGQQWDSIVAVTSVANSACTQLVVNMVLKKTQDIVSHNAFQL